MLGLLLVNKPQGITSFGTVSRIKKISGEKRVGHTGTLDPMATGVLPVLIGKATVLSQYLLDADKSYTATVRLGVTTDSCDITGNVISECTLDKDIDLKSVLQKFTGKQMQVPPMYSAIKQNGVRMYELARRGETAEIPAREIEVLALNQTSIINQQNEFSIDCTVSKGTYIRSLCRDIGEALGCGATLASLTRTSTAGFTIDKCVDLERLTAENICEYILPCDLVVEYMDKLSVSKKQAIRFSNGGELSLDRIKYDCFQNNGLYRIYFENKFLGIGRANLEKQILKIECLVDRQV